MNELIFTRPGEECQIKKRLIEDIGNAKFRIRMAMYCFTDKDIFEAMHDSTASNAMFILNKGDINEIKKSCSYNLVEKYKIHTVILGNNKYSNMHHKFIIIDDIAYIGSYNFTYPASKQNWEFMTRVTDPKEVKKIEEEFWWMWFCGGSKAVEKNKCEKCGFLLKDYCDHFNFIVDYKLFATENDPQKYIEVKCNALKKNCISCNNRAVVTIKNKENLDYCIGCAGEYLNKGFINSQIGWESDNIYYEELAIWDSDNLGKELLGKCDVCGNIEELALLNEIERVKRTDENPYGIEIGISKNICTKCFLKDFYTAYLI